MSPFTFTKSRIGIYKKSANGSQHYNIVCNDVIFDKIVTLSSSFLLPSIT